MITLKQEPMKCVYPKASILLLKPWNSICNRRYCTPDLSGGAPCFNMCLYLQSGEDVPPYLYIQIYLKIETFLCRNMFFLPLRNSKAKFGLAIKIYPVKIFILNESAIWLVNKESHNTLIHCLNSPRRTCRPCGSTEEISFRGHRLLNYIVKKIQKQMVWVPLIKYSAQSSEKYVYLYF